MPIAAFDLQFSVGPSAEPHTRCAVKSCAFPDNGTALCWQHEHFFDFKWSMEGTMLDPSDMWDADDPFKPVLYVATQQELQNLDKSLKVSYQGFIGSEIEPPTGVSNAPESIQQFVTVSREPIKRYADEQLVRPTKRMFAPVAPIKVVQADGSLPA